MYRLTADPYTTNLTTFNNLLHSKGIDFIFEYKEGVGLEYNVVIYIFYIPEDLEKATNIYDQL